jgi:hypothetical protein
MENFNTIISGGYQEKNLVSDSMTKAARTLRPDPRKMKNGDPKVYVAELQLADFKKKWNHFVHGLMPLLRSKRMQKA